MRKFEIQLLPPEPTPQNPNPPQELDEALSTLFTKYLEIGGEGVMYKFSNEGENPGLRCIVCVGIGSGSSTDIGSSFVEIWGMHPSLMTSLGKLQGWKCRVYGGFRKPGLPFAEDYADKSEDPIVEGYIWFPLGNPIRPDYKITLPIVPFISTGEFGTYSEPGGNGLKVVAPAGTTFQQAIEVSMSEAYPDLEFIIDVSEELVFTGETTIGVYGSIQTFVDDLNNWSRDIKLTSDNNYQGIRCAQRGSKIVITDKVAIEDSQVIEIANPYYELVGYPVYNGPTTIQIITPMRSDVKWGDILFIDFEKTGGRPIAQVSGTSVVSGGFYPDIEMKGNYRVVGIKHVGDSTSPDGTQWITMFDCYWSPYQEGEVPVGELQQIAVGDTTAPPTGYNPPPVALGSK